MDQDKLVEECRGLAYRLDADHLETLIVDLQMLQESDKERAAQLSLETSKAFRKPLFHAKKVVLKKTCLVIKNLQ